MIGRESGDILLHDPETSALHAEIEFTKGLVIVRDLGSRNGTWREGKRLPQFALYRGQSFRCGATDITLVEIEGAEAPMVGGTASGSDQVPASSSTVPSGAVLDERPSETISRGVVPPSSSATAPGAGEDEATLLGLAPPPSLSPPPAVGEPPGLGAAPAFGPAPGAPAPIADESSAPVIVPGQPMAPNQPMAPPPGAPMGVPTPVPAAASAPLAPVANAVIKLGDAQPRSAKRREPVDRAARRRLMMRVVLGVVAAGLLGGLIYGIVSLVKGRNQAFVHELAREMPQDTVGILALSSPRDALALFGDEVPAAVREEIDKDLGLDPFSPETYESWGLDLDEPLGVSLLDGEGLFAVSIGVSDKDALRSALSSKAAKLIDAEEDLRWIERSFAETPGLWLDEPAPVAALLHKKRVIFVLGGPADDVARHAKRIAETKSGESLADRPGFGEIRTEKGRPLLALYVDGGSGRAALPGEGASAMATRMALADIDGFAMLLVDDGPRIHLSTQTIMRDGVSSVELFEDVGRKTKLLDQIPAPVLAELDGVFSPDQIRDSLGATGPLGMGAATAFEEGLRKETGLDLRNDLIGNLDGQYGMALQVLPGEDAKEEPAGGLGWVGLRDEAEAKKAAERFFGEKGDDLDIELEQIEGTTVYMIDDRPTVRYFIHGGVLWVAVGRVDIPQIIKGSGTPFRKEPRLPEIEKATAKGGLVAGFLDIRTLLDEIRARIDEDERKDMDEWAPVISPLELLTMRGELQGRTFVARLSLHTSGEHALAELVQGVMKVAGEKMASRLARQRRRDRCDELIDHILELMRAEIKSSSFEEDLLDRRYELMNECTGDQTTDAEIDCMLKATSLDALTRCEDGNGGGEDGGADGGADGGVTPVQVLEQAEPTPVPYVDDIWPNTTSSGTASGRPDAVVSYAVPLGSDPVIRGPEDALVTVVMFGDFQCPYCKRVLPTLDQLLARDREVRLVFRHNPLPMHDKAEIAARAAIAAGKQGKFWQMHDKLYAEQHALSEEAFRGWADELGLDLVRFDRDYADAATKAQIDADIADAKKLGATGTPSFFVNGRYLGGAQPLHKFEEVVAEEKARAERFVERRGNTRKRLYADMIGHFAPEVVAPPTTPIATPVGEKRYTIDTTGLPRLGAIGYVPVEIVECGDLDCPFCKRAETTLDKVLTDYEGKVALFWLHNPLSFHAGAETAARAAEAAHRQGKFWEMQDELIADRTKRSDSDFLSFASDLGLDTKQLELDLSNTDVARTVTDQQKICTDNDARGTPTFFINGRLLAGAQPYDKFKEIIDQELAGGI
ncbi:MAG: thioredoxin domain-containing protein [Myxococcales bacterium]|nr:thioredoxin domain-containing protein [Myxococcales bacterium]